MLRPTLAIKFVVLISLILVITFTCIGVFLIRHQRDILYSDLKTLAVSLSRNLSANSAYGLLTHNIQNLSSLLNSLSNYEDVAFAWIEDDTGRVLSRYGHMPNALTSSAMAELKHQFRDTGEEDGRPEVVSSNRVQPMWIIRQPVMGPQIMSPDELVLEGHPENAIQTRIGTIYLGISLERVNRTLHAMQVRSIGLLAVVALFSTILTLLVVHLIARPLKKLRQATEFVTAGVLPPRVEIHSRDEIGELAEAFNTMIEQVSQSKKAIEKAYIELEQVNQSLEATVAERTAELRNSIAELTEARDQLEAAYSEMKQMYNAKAVFLRSASHELRTPLTAIKANIDFLCQYNADSLGEEGMEIMHTVSNNINNMHFMVEEMLKMVRLDTGAVPLEISAVNLKAVVESCMGELHALQGEIRVEVSIPDDLTLRADKTKLHDLFINLLTNAYRHTPDSGTISIKAWKEELNTVVIVADNGEGIPEEHLSHLFEPFYQAHQGRGGTGLGLSIVKSIVDRHGGSINVQSAPGQGTSFTIYFPDAVPEEETNRHMHSTLPGSQQDKT